MTNPDKMAEELAATCDKHPDALIRHSWDRRQYIMNGYPSGEPIDSNHRYECSECGKELAPPSTN